MGRSLLSEETGGGELMSYTCFTDQCQTTELPPYLLLPITCKTDKLHNLQCMCVRMKWIALIDHTPCNGAVTFDTNQVFHHLLDLTSSV